MENEKSDCEKCGKAREWNVPDPCFGKLPGVMFACCGHGKREGYIYFENGVTLRFDTIRVDTVNAKTLAEWEATFGSKEAWDARRKSDKPAIAA